MLRPRHVPLLLGALHLTGCIGDPPGPVASEGSGTLEVVWNGSATGRFTASVDGVRCLDHRLVEVLAFRGDSGAGFVLWLADSIQPASYPVFPPSMPDAQRPGAAVALRWFSEIKVTGYEGDAGSIVVESVVGTTISGQIDVRLRSVDTPDTLRLSGSFRGIPLAADSTCPVRRI